MTCFRPLIFCAALMLGAPLFAQSTSVAFGTIKQDTSAPVELKSDSLSVDQATGKAIFQGNVAIAQGPMRLSANRVEVVYHQETSGIAQLLASGGVTLVSGSDTVEAKRAEYNIDGGVISLHGEVLLSQGRNAILSEKMNINLRNGTAQMSGSVTSIIQPGAGQ